MEELECSVSAFAQLGGTGLDHKYVFYTYTDGLEDKLLPQGPVTKPGANTVHLIHMEQHRVFRDTHYNTVSVPLQEPCRGLLKDRVVECLSSLWERPRFNSSFVKKKDKEKEAHCPSPRLPYKPLRAALVELPLKRSLRPSWWDRQST